MESLSLFRVKSVVNARSAWESWHQPLSAQDLDFGNSVLSQDFQIRNQGEISIHSTLRVRSGFFFALHGTSTGNLVRLPLSELEIERELNLARAGGGERLQEIGAEHRVDLRYVSAIEQIDCRVAISRTVT